MRENKRRARDKGKMNEGKKEKGREWESAKIETESGDRELGGGGTAGFEGRWWCELSEQWMDEAQDLVFFFPIAVNSGPKMCIPYFIKIFWSTHAASISLVTLNDHASWSKLHNIP